MTPPVPSPRAVCTIIAKNYLASARVLMDSVAAREPSAARYVLVIDEWKGWIDPARENFTLLSLDDLELPDPRRYCFRYDVIELATAVKPRLLQLLLARHDKAIYLDPDIMVLNPLEPLFSMLDAHHALLTPHITEPYPDDGLWPYPSIPLVFGVFNLGFIGIRRSREGDAFLLWWRDFLDRYSVKDPNNGFFVDQKVIDLAQVLFPIFHVVREPGYNVAYWNVHCQNVERAGERWLCNGQPLAFFHFSSFSPENPGELSKFEPMFQKRYDLGRLPGLRELLADYAARLIARQFHEQRGWPYSHATFTDGAKIPYKARVLLRQSPEALPAGDDPFRSPAFRRQFSPFWKLVRKAMFHGLFLPYHRLKGFVRRLGVPSGGSAS